MESSEKVASGPNNTKCGTIYRRIYLLTLNEKTLEFYKDIIKYLTGLKSFQYLLCCEHIGQENKHYHIALQLKACLKLSIKKLHGAHIDSMKFGSINKIINYCRCLDNKHQKLGIKSVEIDEIGEVKLNGGFKTVREILESNEEELKDVDPKIYRICKEIKNEQREKDSFNDMLNEIRNECLKAPEVIYINGLPGQGKTYGAYKECVKIEEDNNKIGKLTIQNNFCSFINPTAENLIIEEFRPNQMYASDFLQLTDKYGYQANIKGGKQYVRPKRIFICSVLHPSEIYKDENNAQFIRRITKFYQAVDKELIECDLNDMRNYI